MNTGFKNLDEIIDIEQPQVIVLSGNNADILSGDIANNICLKQEHEVLEIVRCKKEYLIKRLLINECDVDYRDWALKDKYTNQELQKIGQVTVNLIEVTKRLPTIIEQDMYLYDLKNVDRLVDEWANDYADRKTNETLVVLDIFPLSSQQISRRKVRKEVVGRFVKKMQKISKKLNTSIIIVCNIDLEKKYNKTSHQLNYLTKTDIEYINTLNKYVDKFVILNIDTKEDTSTYNVDVYNANDKIDTKEDTSTYNVDVYNANDKLGTCKLEYDFRIRKFKDYKGTKRCKKQ